MRPNLPTLPSNVSNVESTKSCVEVRRKYFKPPYPASTLVEVKSLVDPHLMIEINAVTVVAG